MSRSLHPPCIGPHGAKVPRAYTVVAPDGTVFWSCDSDCLRRHLDRLEEQAAADVRRSVRKVTR